ncbi:flagellar basal body-associated FliL family protein [Gorillibacterium timonense]|uniref:flagellar basal body-associated FliL family protein n=1 Tax=Gorillibacterium timonense TaxID=1689269 RepID=UPI00071CD4EA|nr:flagellar basal body-associated FliL family protein [Gorillibacterium timonense]
MIKKKMVPLVLALLCVIFLIALAAVWVFNTLNEKNSIADPSQKAVNSVESVEGKKVSAAEVKKLTVSIENVVTNLSEPNKAVKASFAFELSGQKGMKEFENYDARVKSVINMTLADLTNEQLAGSKGQDYLASLLMNKINSFLSEGKVSRVNITELIVQ